MWPKDSRQVVERLFNPENRAPIHTRTMLTHTWNNPLSSCWPRWAELSVNWALCPRLGVERAESDASAISRIVWQAKPGRTRLPPSSRDRFSLTRAFLGILPPTPYHARSNLLFFLFSSSQASERDIPTILRRGCSSWLSTSIENHRISISPLFLENAVDSRQKKKWNGYKLRLDDEPSNYFQLLNRKLYLLNTVTDSLLTNLILLNREM